MRSGDSNIHFHMCTVVYSATVRTLLFCLFTCTLAVVWKEWNDGLVKEADGS